MRRKYSIEIKEGLRLEFREKRTETLGSLTIPQNNLVGNILKFKDLTSLWMLGKVYNIPGDV